MKSQNLFQNIPHEFPTECVDILSTAQNVRVERIVSHGHSSPDGFWYDQAEHEWVMVVSGQAKLQFKESNDIVDMKAGDWLEIPAHCLHRVIWTDPQQQTIWLAIFYIKKTDANV
jgi:cupin 2 domain-containing protein